MHYGFALRAKDNSPHCAAQLRRMTISTNGSLRACHPPPLKMLQAQHWRHVAYGSLTDDFDVLIDVLPASWDWVRHLHDLAR